MSTFAHITSPIPASAALLSLPAYPHPVPLAQARHDLPPAEFRDRLRQHLLAHPDLRLAQVACQLGLTRQRVGQLVGPLARPTCAEPGPRPAPRRDEARAKMEELRARVAGGESAAGAASGLGLSLSQARRLGFRVGEVRPEQRQATSRRPAIIDWLAWRDPDSGASLRQREVARLAGVAQQTVSKVALALREMEEDKDE